ncbi:hypothetical protein Vadar_007799 [Vaccinium darrowii]|uniref:Uncharacterized protein n=1 Tax=Vaccinium darrowii TaxID=229202 RepID=A0ACB7YUL5_9ERIC|nr:hypothetical protein Vadar_007799 [Vaccinium darrowii]
MLVLTWNCQGVGRTLTGQALGDLVRKNRPSILFLMESKNNKVKMETIRRSLGFVYSHYVDPEGLSGGLALWWNTDVDMVVEMANKNLMHVMITEIPNRKIWAATFVYGCPVRTGRSLIWEEIRKIASYETLPWVCMGDFNQVLGDGEKMGGNCPRQSSITEFHGMISDSGLIDLEFKGPRFTWRNNRRGEEFIMERIDMAFANYKWRELYDKAMVFVEPAVGSDHNPLAAGGDSNVLSL